MRNILPNITTTYLKTCIYDAKTDPFCPIFRLGTIVESAGHSFQDIAIEVGAGLGFSLKKKIMYLIIWLYQVLVMASLVAQLVKNAPAVWETRV